MRIDRYMGDNDGRNIAERAREKSGVEQGKSRSKTTRQGTVSS